MSRTRLIKPGFFTNDTLAEVSPIGRLLFAGLWVIADRDGRLEDRPKRIKAEVLPFDNANVDRLLGELADRGFIVRYESEGQRLIQIVAFTRHQSPHPKEPTSKLPAMGESVTSHLQDTDKTLSSPSVSIPSPILDPVLKSSPGATDGPRDGDDGFRRATDALTRLGARLNPIAYDDIGGLLDEGYKPEWFELGCMKAAENGAQSWAYVKKVITGWGLGGPPALKPVAPQPIEPPRRTVNDILAEQEESECRFAERIKREGIMRGGIPGE